MFVVGAADPAKLAESEKTGVPVPSTHSPYFAPVAEPMLKTGAAALSIAALDLLSGAPAK
jgi:hippurate hydrolase